MSNFIKNKIEELLQKPNDATFEPDNEFFESLKDDTKGEDFLNQLGAKPDNDPKLLEEIKKINKRVKRKKKIKQFLKNNKKAIMITGLYAICMVLSGFLSYIINVFQIPALGLISAIGAFFLAKLSFDAIKEQKTLSDIKSFISDCFKNLKSKLSCFSYSQKFNKDDISEKNFSFENMKDSMGKNTHPDFIKNSNKPFEKNIKNTDKTPKYEITPNSKNLLNPSFLLDSFNENEIDPELYDFLLTQKQNNKEEIISYYHNNGYYLNKTQKPTIFNSSVKKETEQRLNFIPYLNDKRPPENKTENVNNKNVNKKTNSKIKGKIIDIKYNNIEIKPSDYDDFIYKFYINLKEASQNKPLNNAYHEDWAIYF